MNSNGLNQYFQIVLCKIFILTVLTLFSFDGIVSQDKIIKGKVTDSKHQAIQFVNIGIIGKNIGSISNLHGNFEISIPIDLINDSLTFSIIGYKNKTVGIGGISGFANIQLEDTIFSIKTVTIVPKQKVVLGPGKASKGIGAGGLTEVGFEVGRIFEPKVFPARINSLNIYFGGSTLDTCNFRLNFYYLKEGYPSDKIPVHGLLYKGHYDKGWLNFDLKDKQLWLEQPFIASIEWIPTKDLNGKYGFWFGASLIGAKKTFARKTSLGNFTKMKSGNIVMNVEVEY